MTTWDEVEGQVRGLLAGLTPDAFVILQAGGAAAREVVRRRRRLGGLVAEARATQRPFVQLRRLGDDLWAECVGGPRVGGPFPWTDEQEDAIAALGWAPPDRARLAVAHYWREWPGAFRADAAPGQGATDAAAGAPAAGAADAAALTIGTLRRVAGCSAADVAIESGA